MSKPVLLALTAPLAAIVHLLGPAPSARADSIAGLCPDGSMFIVADRADAPCSRAKFVEPSELPPIKPQYLPREYTWYVDREIQDENNPYNLIDRVQRMRELRAGTATPEPAPESALGARAATVPDARVSATADEARDLVRFIALKQELAPATLEVSDASERPELVIRFAHSRSFEEQVLGQLGRAQDGSLVVAFSARSESDTEFYPSFQMIQGGDVFRPDANRPDELGFVVGGPGGMQSGTLVLGYLVAPPRFDASRPLELWWNDRRVEVTLD